MTTPAGPPDFPTSGAETPALPPELTPLAPVDPTRVGQYRIVGRLGEGGMGAVYGGVDEQGRCLAVKTVHARHAANERFRETFAREVELLARVDGVCVPAVRAADAAAEIPWMATDFVPGRNLRQHINELGPLEGPMLAAFAAGTAEALAAIHAAGVVHCDIKPGNVILSPGGPRIVDFGIATTADAAATGTAGSFGTPGWISPERYTGRPAAPAADVFAWGALVAMAATGHAPFGAGSTEERKQRVLSAEADLDGLPEDLRALAIQALAKDPDRRPTAEDILRSVLADTLGEPEQLRRPLGDLTRVLKGMLAATWQGIDAAGHHPAAWAAIGGAAGAAGMAGVAGTAMGAGSAGGGLAGTGGAAAGIGIVSAKAAAITATAVITTGTVGAGGYFIYDSFAAPEPEQVAAEAEPSPEPSPLTPAEMAAEGVDLLVAADSFEASVTGWTADGAALEDIEPPDGTVDPFDISEEQYRFTADPEPTLEQVTTVTGEGQVPTVRVGDEVLQFNYLNNLWTRNPSFLDAADYTPEGVAGGTHLQAIADSGDIAEDGEETLGDTAAIRYSGTFEDEHILDFAPDGGEITEPATGDFVLWLDEDGYPLRIHYEFPERGVDRFGVVEFSGYGEAVAIDVPSPDLIIDE